MGGQYGAPSAGWPAARRAPIRPAISYRIGSAPVSQLRECAAMTLLERIVALYQVENWGVAVDDEIILLDALTSVADMYLDRDGIWNDHWDDDDFVRAALGIKAGCLLPHPSELTEDYLVKHLTDEELGSAIESALEDFFGQGWSPTVTYQRRLEARERYREAYDPNVAPETARQPIEDLNLSNRQIKVLKGAGLNTIGDLLKQAEDDLLALPHFGFKTLNDVLDRLDEVQLSLMPEPEIHLDGWPGQNLAGEGSQS